MLSNYYLTAAIGEGKTELNSFDSALIEAGIGDYNLVKVSSILPKIARRKEKVDVEKGQVLHVAYASITSNANNTVISAAVAIGIPKDCSRTGIIMEYSDYCSKQEAEQIVSSMVNDAMKLRNNDIESIIISSSSCVTVSEKYCSAFAAVALW